MQSMYIQFRTRKIFLSKKKAGHPTLGYAFIRFVICSQYVGKWYEIEKYFAFFEFGGKCVTAIYSEGENSAINILNKQISAL